MLIALCLPRSSPEKAGSPVPYSQSYKPRGGSAAAGAAWTCRCSSSRLVRVSCIASKCALWNLKSGVGSAAQGSRPSHRTYNAVVEKLRRRPKVVFSSRQCRTSGRTNSRWRLVRCVFPHAPTFCLLLRLGGRYVSLTCFIQAALLDTGIFRMPFEE